MEVRYTILNLPEASNGLVLALIAAFFVGAMVTVGAYRGDNEQRSRATAGVPVAEGTVRSS